MLRLFALTVPVWLAAAAGAQESRPSNWRIDVGGGFTQYFSDEGNPQGAVGLLGIEWRRPNTRLGLRLRGTAHRFDEIPLSPCMFQDASGCYQSSHRSLGVTEAAASYRVGPRDERTSFYLSAGLGYFESRRVATRYPDCVPDLPCFNNTTTRSYRDRDIGLSCAIGVDFHYRDAPFFVELGIGAPSMHHFSGDTPLNGYTLLPITAGVRF
jgi:hypothetical protein